MSNRPSTNASDRKIIKLYDAGLVAKDIVGVLKLKNKWCVYNALRRKKTLTKIYKKQL